MALSPTFPPVSSPKPDWVRECQFIADDAPTVEQMCREPVRRGSSYCPSHHALCFVPIRGPFRVRMAE